MENKNLIIEELKRVKLLMGYKTENTLTENESKVRVNQSLFLTEGAGQAILKGLFGGADDAARAAALSSGKGLPKAVINQMDDALRHVDDITVAGKRLTKSDEIIRAMEAGQLTSGQISKIKTGFLKSGNVSPELRKVLVDQASRGKTAEKLASLSKEEIAAVLKKNGYQGSIADDVAYKIKDRYGSKVVAQSSATSGAQSATGKLGTGTKTAGTGTKTAGTGAKTGGKIAPGKTTGKGRVKNTNKPTKPRAKANKGKLQKQPGKPSKWQQFKDRIKGLTRTKIFKYLLIAGGLYLVYKWWTDEGSAPFPDCIGKNIPEDDFEKMVNEGDGSVLISDTGVDALDRAGGGKFYDDKKFVTGDGRYSGTWQDVPGTGIVITIEGQDYTMSCEGKIEDEEDDDNDGGDGGDGGNSGGYTPCSSFPYKKGCKSTDISKVQSCLGISADGKLGPGTEKALKAKGYSVPLTKSDYDKIVANCGGSSSSSTTTTTTLSSGPDFSTSQDV